MLNWRLHVNVKGDYYVYFRTNRKYVPEMVIDLAVRQGHLLDVFAEFVDEVVTISDDEYFRHMFE